VNKVKESRIAFKFWKLKTDVLGLFDEWDLYQRVEASFAMEICDQVIYQEELFPVVEFATLSQIWLSEVDSSPKDFIYSSIESDVVGLVWFKRITDGWSAGSAFQSSESPVALNLWEVRNSLNGYYNSLRGAVKEQFGLDIAALQEWKKRPQSNGKAGGNFMK
jgi:hypothetical protein